ncbi:competence type IV pilus minor pilin ComGD [Neobacillus sp. PS2-9]|uniref:competence type IV pilus minor pilin ComGD n=1 Tax=Neobacillus sp. PS2-9 TaxID=3070676 RepID=UPI0027E1F7D5|nr:competence type IV pilus minor pilin ComGD [Neobacillus sp. PS2-9]WML59755.1 competence type IV pilus minor pilin ComGD [Neobacillus sp. PS2-9]
MNWNQKGFTLIESLLVLSIFMIISSVTVFTLKPQHTFMEKDSFFIQLKADLYYAQQYAISHQHEVLVQFVPKEYRYYMIYRAEERPIIERDYSHNVNFTEGTMPLSFKFLPDGNINKFGSLILYYRNKIYRLTFLIGEGRFYVSEQ